MTYDDEDTTQDEITRLRAELAEMNALFELQYTRMSEATALWQAEAPVERRGVMPDLGALLAWLMERKMRRQDNEDTVNLNERRAIFVYEGARIAAINWSATRTQSSSRCARSPAGGSMMKRRRCE